MDDLISRQAAIDLTIGLSNDSVDFVRAGIKALPPAQPERKKGTWIDAFGLYKCSLCGKLYPHWWEDCVSMKQMRKDLRYCPYCGAEMREEKTDAENN